MKRSSIIILISLFLSGCATHPTVSTTPMEKGEKKYGWSWSAENVFPYLWYRYGITDKDDIGIRVGPAIYGTGIDYSRILFVKKNKWDVMNLSWSMNPNYNSDFTYYKFKQRINKDDSKGAISWWGIRMMYIPEGITGGTSTRMGFLLGGQPNQKWGYEIGYSHDFSSIPITICSAAVLGVLLERYFFYNRNHRDISRFIHNLQKQLEKGLLIFFLKLI